MRIHVLQHIGDEPPATIGDWAVESGYQLSCTRLHLDEPLPSADDIDWLVIMGGLMGVHDTEEYPWLEDERQLIRDMAQRGKRVLGICLGAQQVAHALGAQVKVNEHREIGWFEIRRRPEAGATPLAKILPPAVCAFHWHSDTFELPEGATPLLSSDACRNQGFVIDNIVALQCHLEATETWVNRLLKNGADELQSSSPYVQEPEQMRAPPERFQRSTSLMKEILAEMAVRN